jgi:hypothetical protein
VLPNTHKLTTRVIVPQGSQYRLHVAHDVHTAFGSWIEGRRRCLFTVTFGVYCLTLWILSAMSGSEVPAA